VVIEKVIGERIASFGAETVGSISGWFSSGAQKGGQRFCEAEGGAHDWYGGRVGNRRDVVLGQAYGQQGEERDPKAIPGSAGRNSLGVASLRSAMWAFWTTCHADDLVYDWTVSGSSEGTGSEGHPGRWHIDPWEPTPITIRGVELVVVRGPTPTWLMAGNGIDPDAMAVMASPERHVMNRFPAGTGMSIPAKGDAKLNQN
jgi:hypothetical protein